MKKLGTLLAISLVAGSLGCRSNKLASRAVAPDPVASPQIFYVFDDGFRRYFGPNEALALAQALREAHPGYQVQVDFAEPAK